MSVDKDSISSKEKGVCQRLKRKEFANAYWSLPTLIGQKLGTNLVLSGFLRFIEGTGGPLGDDSSEPGAQAMNVASKEGKLDA
jgi:hypothetical protein